MDPGPVGAGVRAAARRALPVRGAAGTQVRDGMAAGTHRGVLRPRARLLRDRGRVPAGPVLRALGADDPAAAGGAAVPRAGPAADPADHVTARARAPDRGRDTQPGGQGRHLPGGHHRGPGDRAVRGVLHAVVRRRIPQRRGARTDPPGADDAGVRVLLDAAAGGPGAEGLPVPGVTLGHRCGGGRRRGAWPRGDRRPEPDRRCLLPRPGQAVGAQPRHGPGARRRDALDTRGHRGAAVPGCSADPDDQGGRGGSRGHRRRA